MDNFLKMFKEVLEIEEMDIDIETKFRELEEWDSLTVLSVLAMVSDEYDTAIPREEFSKVETIKDLYNLIQK